MRCPSSPKQEWCLRPPMFAPEASKPLRALLYCSRVRVSGFTYTAITMDSSSLAVLFSRHMGRHAGERTHVSQASEPMWLCRDDIKTKYTVADLVQELPVTERSEVLRDQRPESRLGMCESSRRRP